MQDVISQRPDGLQSGDSFYRPIRDKALVGMSMYGPEYGSRPSISNVDEFHLGNMDLKKAGDNYKITSVHKGSNGDMPTGQFAALLFARFQNISGDAKAAGEVLKNARVGIFPMAKTPAIKVAIPTNQVRNCIPVKKPVNFAISFPRFTLPNALSSSG